MKFSIPRQTLVGFGVASMVLISINSVNLINQQIKELEKLTVDNPRQQQRINTIKPLVARRLAALSQVIELRKKKGFEAAVIGVKTSQGSQIMARIRDVLHEMEGEEAALLKERIRPYS